MRGINRRLLSGLRLATERIGMVGGCRVLRGRECSNATQKVGDELFEVDETQTSPNLQGS